jgi:hypothetical protein
MELKYCCQSIDIDGLSVAEAISALQAWENENSESATDSHIAVYPDGSGGAHVEIWYYRPYTEEEIASKKLYEKLWEERKEAADLAEYERLKAKYEN